MDRGEVEVNHFHPKKNEASILNEQKVCQWELLLVGLNREHPCTQNRPIFSARIENQFTGCTSSYPLTKPAIKYDDYSPSIFLIVCL